MQKQFLLLPLIAVATLHGAASAPTHPLSALQKEVSEDVLFNSALLPSSDAKLQDKFGSIMVRAYIMCLRGLSKDVTDTWPSHIVHIDLQQHHLSDKLKKLTPTATRDDLQSAIQQTNQRKESLEALQKSYATCPKAKEHPEYLKERMNAVIAQRLEQTTRWKQMLEDALKSAPPLRQSFEGQAAPTQQ